MADLTQIPNSKFTDPILKEIESVLFYIVQNYAKFIQEPANTHEKISEYDKELGDFLERYKQLYNITSNITEAELQTLKLELNAQIQDLKTKLSNNYFKGEKGDKGDQGIQGIQGLKGDSFTFEDFTPQQIETLKIKGDKGDKGDQGIQGIQGEKGDKGDQGIQGIQGEKGDKGDQGIQGEKGDKGDQGIQGVQGVQGEKGEKGDQGIQGIQGLKGDKGEKGDTPTILDVLDSTSTSSSLSANQGKNLKSLIDNKVSKISSPTANALVKVNADGTIENTDLILDNQGNLTLKSRLYELDGLCSFLGSQLPDFPINPLYFAGNTQTGAISNLNDLKINGKYNSYPSVLNQPINDYGFIDVFAHSNLLQKNSSDWVAQVWYSMCVNNPTPRIFIRNCIFGNWSSWVEK